MTYSNDTPATERLVDNILNTCFEDIDQATVDVTRWRILDMIGDALGGAMCPGSPELADMVRHWGGREESTILGYGYKAPAHEVAMVNCIFGRSFDRGPLTLIIDGQRFPNHTTETTVLTALAVGEGRSISGKELITSIIVGDDLAARLHIASDHAQPGQATGAAGSGAPTMRTTTDIFGAAAIAGRLYGLSAAQMKSAFGLVSIMVGGGGNMPRLGPAGSGRTPPPQPAIPKWLGVKDPVFQASLAQGGYEETASVKLVQGLIAKRGITAALLAAAGWTGVKDALFGERGGYYPGFGSVGHPERVLGNLGKVYHVEKVFKPYPGGKPTHAPTDAALAIVRKNDIDTDDITEVILHLSPPATAAHYAKAYMVGDYPTMNALWSYYFCVASALYNKSSVDANYTTEKILDPKLQALIKKVKLGDLDKPTGVELEVRMKDGKVYTEYVPVASGEPSNPMSDDDLLAKFREQVEFSGMVSQKNMEKLIELLLKLEEVKDINQIVKLAAR